MSLGKAILLFLALTFSGNALHLHGASENYVSYLQNQQNNVKDKINTVARKLQENYKVVDKENDINKKIALLEQYIKEERLLLAGINLQTVNQQLSSSDWVCPVLSDPRKKEIQDNIADIGKDLNDINKILTPLDDAKTGPGINDAKQQIKDAEKINDKLKDALNSKGVEVDPSAIHPDKKTNLNAANWVLDGKKIDELNQQYKKAAESGALEICDISQPFFSTKQNKCVSCSGQKLVFSLRTSECTKCYNFDNNEHKCKDNEGAGTNILPSVEDKIIVPEGKTLDDYKKNIPTGKVLCPENAPFFTGQECIQCEKYFDIETKQCKKCQGKNHYDPKTHTCQMPEITVSNVDAGKNALIVPNDKTLNDVAKDNKKLEDDNKVKVCPSNKPFFNDFQCISCNEGTLFSLTQKSCGTCETGTFFNKDTNHCENKSFYSNLQDPNWQSTKKYPDIQKQIEQKAKDPLYEKCPVQKPFSTGKQCIQCSNDEHFNYDQKKCTKCYNGQYFNKNLHSCTSSQPNFQTNPEKAPNLIFQGHPKNEWMYNYYKNIEDHDGMNDCPQQKPFFDGIQCIICPEEHPYFNLEYKMCQKCAQGTKFDKDHHECLTTQGNIATQVPTLEKMAAGIFA